MTKDTDEHSTNAFDADVNRLNVTADIRENLGYPEHEMIECGKCRRTNPPNRLKCFYCGDDLDIVPAKGEFIKLSLRQLETWEKGFSVVITQPSQSVVEMIVHNFVHSQILHREALQKIMSASVPVPLAHVENEREAAIICARIKNLGIECEVVADESLDPNRPARRLRRLEFEYRDIAAIDFNTDEIYSMAGEDLVLIVTGKLFERKTQSLEKKTSRSRKIIDQMETVSDESVIDLYARNEMFGFRIYQSGFDFACLGNEKSLLAADNMPKLITKLRKVSPLAKLVSEYGKIQTGLEAVWQLESRKNSEGLRRSGFGKKDFGNILTVTNQSQFTRYSRLQRHFI